MSSVNRRGSAGTAQLSAVSTRRRNGLRSGGEVEPKSVPFVPEKPSPAHRRREIDSPPSVLDRAAPVAKPPRVRRRLRPGGLYRWVRRFRVPVALMLGISAAAVAILAAESAQLETTTAVRVNTSVAAGSVLTAEMLEQVDVDSAAVPADHVAEISEYVGGTAASALPTGSLIHPSHLVGPGLLEGHDPGTVAVPVRPADASMITLLSPGQHVDVTASTDASEAESGTERIAEAAPVLWIPQDESENWLGGADQGSHVVILAVDSTTAETIAEAEHQGRLHLSLVSGPSDHD